MRWQAYGLTAAGSLSWEALSTQALGGGLYKNAKKRG
tara:strand:+ start:319 stop:429 length:111 start_codon:yes stop_codon:yes gene_type:complete